MAKFKFKFDNVKKVKEALETKAKKEIAVIDSEIVKENDARQKLIDETNENTKNFSKNNIKISELKFIKNYVTVNENKIEKIDESIHKLDIKRDIKMNELIEKKKETKILEILEENMQKDYNKEQNKIDLKKFDEIATQKFGRQGK
jgi:flagellar export protein FliJ